MVTCGLFPIHPLEGCSQSAEHNVRLLLYIYIGGPVVIMRSFTSGFVVDLK